MKNSENSTEKMGLTACVMLLIGAMIGSAIFSLSGLTILMAGPAATLSWLIGGIIMLAYGMFTAELACRYPKSGGLYVFPRMAFKGKCGLYLGWLSCWSAMLTNIVAIAFSGIYVGLYLSVSFAWAAKLQLPLAIGSILFCLVINLLKISLASKINTVIVSILVLTIAAYIMTAFCGGSYSPPMLMPFFHQGSNGPAGFIMAIPTAIIGYSGIVSLSFMVSQVRNAHKNIPIAMLLAMSIVAMLYLLVITATVGLVSAQFLTEHPDMQFIPLFSACFTKLSSTPWLLHTTSISAVLALMTTMLVCVTMNAWTIHAASQDGFFPTIFGKITQNGVPAMGALLTCSVAMIYSCFPQFTQQIVNFGAIFNIITMILTLLALIKSRQVKDEKQLFSAPGGKPMPFIMLIILLTCNMTSILSGGTSMWIYTLGFLFLGLLIALFKHK